jgi:nucleotide-binding universal stress UspA family protein
MNGTKTRILVAVDGSDYALNAVRYAGKVLPPQTVEVVLFHVAEKIPSVFWDLGKSREFHMKASQVTAWALQQEKAIHDYMEKARKILLDSGLPSEFIKDTIQEKKVGIARDILAESKKKYDAVAVGRRGVSKLKDLVLGSISTKLIQNLSHVPVWVVGDQPQLGNILLAVDGSEGAYRAVDYVAKVMSGSSVPITLFYVVRGIDHLPMGYDQILSPELDEDWLTKARESITPVFAEARKRLTGARIPADRINTKIVTGAMSRAGAIVGEAENEGYGTIVMGRRGLTNISEFFMGRVSNKVIQLTRKTAVWVVD